MGNKIKFEKELGQCIQGSPATGLARCGRIIYQGNAWI